MPNVTRVGSASCIADGELSEDALPPGVAINGFSPECFSQEDEREAVWQKASSIESCGTMRAYAWIIYYLYLNDETRITNFLREWLGDDFAIHYVRETDRRPAAVILRATTWTVCIFDGTRNTWQLATQTFNELLTPTNYGLYSTNPFWQSAANSFLITLETLGVPPTQKILFAGHSFGAAVSSILASMYRSGQPERTLALLTFGLPKVGDTRLIALMDQCRQVHVQNDDDIVTILPPDEQVKNLLQLVFNLPIGGLWNGWTRVTLPWVQARDGTLTRAQLTPPDLETWAQMVVDRLNGEDLNPVAGHQVDEYWRRINLRCPDAEWPIDTEESEILKLDWVEPGILEMGGDLLYPGGGIELGGDLLYPGGGIELGGDLLYPGGGIELGGDLLYPRGGIELGGETILPAGAEGMAGRYYETPILEMAGRSTDLPGKSCPAAFPMTLGTTYSGICYTGPDLYFSRALTAGTTYRLTFTISAEENFTVEVRTGAVCPGAPNGPALTFLAQTRTLFTAINTNLYLLLKSGVGTHTQSYSLQVKTPP